MIQSSLRFHGAKPVASTAWAGYTLYIYIDTNTNIRSQKKSSSVFNNIFMFRLISLDIKSLYSYLPAQHFCFKTFCLFIYFFGSFFFFQAICNKLRLPAVLTAQLSGNYWSGSIELLFPCLRCSLTLSQTLLLLLFLSWGSGFSLWKRR